MKNSHNNETVRVSVALASYNGEKFIVEQIESILKNLGDSDELIISDDGSTDSTLEIINSFALRDSRVKIVQGPKQGVVRNFENAIKHSVGEYIFLSDQDDFWYDNKVQTVLKDLEDYTLVCHNADIFDNATQKITGSVQEKFGTHNTVFKNLISNSFIGCCMAFRRKLLDFVLPFPSERDINMHDWWIGLTALKVGKVRFNGERLMAYRIHENNAVGFKKTSLFFKIKKRFRMMGSLRKVGKRK